MSLSLYEFALYEFDYMSLELYEFVIIQFCIIRIWLYEFGLYEFVLYEITCDRYKGGGSKASIIVCMAITTYVWSMLHLVTYYRRGSFERANLFNWP